MSHQTDSNQNPPLAINYFLESLKSLTRDQLAEDIEGLDDEGFSPFPQEGELDEEDLKAMSASFQEHAKLKPHLEDLLKLLNQKDPEGDGHTSVSLRMSTSDRDQIITNLQKAQSDVESIQGQLSYILSQGFFNSELEQHAKILHKLSISAVADLLPKEIKEALEKGKPQFQQFSSKIHEEIDEPDLDDVKLPPISNLNIKEAQNKGNGIAQKKSKTKKSQQKAQQKTRQTPDILPYEPDECIICEYYHVFGKQPVNLIKAYDKRLKEETSMRNNLENRTRRKKRQQKKR